MRFLGHAAVAFAESPGKTHRYVHLLMPCETMTIGDRIVVVTYSTAPGNREEDLETLAQNWHVFETGYPSKKERKRELQPITWVMVSRSYSSPDL